ncbi:MAG: FeoB-associated Cys-rich membrane protein [Clostridia bacterium]|nr:FeoB-associated Cys-rich membrane protein [Clostridia bacterium]MBQ2190789.1 FeoB-associated Cys-rich membrane protein [Clostridia bacterium]
MKWLIENWTTLLVIAAIATLVALIIVKMVRDRRAGKSSCGCGCASCPMSGSCHKAEEKK